MNRFDSCYLWKRESDRYYDIVVNVTCGYRKCSPGSNGVQSNVWLCLNSPYVSSGSLPAIWVWAWTLGKKNPVWDEKGPWGSSRPSGVLDSSAARGCLPFPMEGCTYTRTVSSILTAPKYSGVQPEFPWTPIGLEFTICIITKPPFSMGYLLGNIIHKKRCS